MNVVANNIPGMFTSRQIGITNRSKVKSMEKLSSGYKINRAADDAAGLTISENMRRMIRGLTQASLNVQDGVSLCQVADGYLDEVHDMLHRLTELSVKGSNGTLTDDDRQAINEEVGALKEEMRRIFNVANFNEIPLFHVPYMPEILSQPTDMEVFHTGTGNVVGGLEFNNVRYSIPELQALGIPIDDNGIATEDLKAGDAIFELWDGEEVDLSIKQGQTIDQAARNYKWTATDEGILINNKLSAEWSEVKGPDGNPLGSTPSTFATGMYSFSHHGMNIEFGIDEEATLEEVMNGINGDAATIPATWDVSAGGSTTKPAATIDTGIQSINVTNANQGFIDHRFSVVANESGIAIKDISAGYTTGYKAWETFSDSYAKNKDENGNDVETNDGYPIKNWGTGVDANGPSEITFDDSARYSYKATDSSVPTFSFAFKLAESASVDEVGYALSNEMSTSGVYAKGTLTAGSATTYGVISLTNSETTRSLINNSGDRYGLASGDFALQRAYGRDFDEPWGEMAAGITITRSTISGQPSAVDRPDASGGYAGNTHTVSGRSLTGQTYNGSDISGETINYYIRYEQVGRTDESGNPVYDEETGDQIIDNVAHYYKYRQYTEDKKYTNTYSATDTWNQSVNYTFDGSLNGHDMSDVTRTQTEKYRRSLTQTRIQTDRYDVASVEEIDESALPSDVKAAMDVDPSSYAVTNLPAARNNRTGRTYGDYTTTNVGSESMIDIDANSFNNIAFKTSEDNVTGQRNAFVFNYSVNLDQARALASNSGAQSAGTVTFKSNGNAYRLFNQNIKGSIDEAEFNDISLNAPRKNLIIQAGADKDTTITMEWSALNLTILGISGANTLTQDSSRAAIGMVQKALNVISDTRSLFGAYQNRFEHTIANLDNVVENTQAAESQIRDTDMSSEMVKLAKDNILEQAGTAMLVQSNRSKDWVISLLNS